MKKVLTTLPIFILGLTALAGCAGRTIKLSDAFSFLKNDSGSFVRLRKEHGYISVGPGDLNDVWYSEDEADIRTALTMLDQKAEKAETQMMPDGGFYFDYRFYSDKDTYDLIRIANNLISYKDTFYELKEPYDIELKNDGDQINSFVTYGDEFKVYRNDEFVTDFDKVRDLEFVKTEEIAKEKICVIKCLGFELEVLSKDEFRKDRRITGAPLSYDYFRTVGDIDFSSII